MTTIKGIMDEIKRLKKIKLDDNCSPEGIKHLFLDRLEELGKELCKKDLEKYRLIKGMKIKNADSKFYTWLVDLGSDLEEVTKDG